jgi:hypothetical protein
MAQGRSNQEISEQLVLALSTVKGHNRNIFGKLQVQRRTEAVARARELGLVESCPQTWYYNVSLLPQPYPKHYFRISLFLP